MDVLITLDYFSKLYIDFSQIIPNSLPNEKIFL